MNEPVNTPAVLELNPTPNPRVAVPPTAPTSICRDMTIIHPIVREQVHGLITQLATEGIPFAVFESFRPGNRQQYLYDQGRKRKGPIVTYAAPYQSYHQFGLACDLVLKLDNIGWSWDQGGIHGDWWKRMRELAETQYGLELLSFEQPHVQFAGLAQSDLNAGKLPGGGDDDWWNNLLNTTKIWNAAAAKPPAPKLG